MRVRWRRWLFVRCFAGPLGPQLQLQVLWLMALGDRATVYGVHRWCDEACIPIDQSCDGVAYPPCSQFFSCDSCTQADAECCGCVIVCGHDVHDSCPPLTRLVDRVGQAGIASTVLPRPGVKPAPRLQHVQQGTFPRVTRRATMFRQRRVTMTTPSSPEALGLSCSWLRLVASSSPSVCAVSVCVGKRMLQTTVVAMACLKLPQQHPINRTSHTPLVDGRAAAIASGCSPQLLCTTISDILGFDAQGVQPAQAAEAPLHMAREAPYRPVAPSIERVVGYPAQPPAGVRAPLLPHAAVQGGYGARTARHSLDEELPPA